MQSLTLTFPPALEAPSLWCGNHFPSHPLQGTAVRQFPCPPPPKHTHSLYLLYTQNFLKVVVGQIFPCFP